MPPAPPSSEDSRASLRLGFAALAGLFLGLGLLKFGNPAILDHLVARPENYLEWVFLPWPLAWGYALLAGLAVFGVFIARWRLPRPSWVIGLPAVWLAWQFVTARDSIDPALTSNVLPHFTATVGGFYLGCFVLAPATRLRLFWFALLACLGLVLLSGFQQRFGGLEAVRQHVYSQPGWENLPPEYLRRLSGNRIFGTLLYPNTLAGVILLLLPPLLVALWRLTAEAARPVRLGLVACLAAAGFACLYWSRSKAGWLIALVVGMAWVFRLPGGRRLKLALAGAALMVGLAGFGIRFAGYFQQGATSVGARFDYWQAAWKSAADHPLTGTGPGTFATAYRRLKPPDAEMARLAHNDYLQQASDSGLPGASLYLTFVAVSMIVLLRRSAGCLDHFAVWTGLLGWALQSGVEFGLYVPAVGWTAFWLLGWLWGAAPEPARAKAVDTGPAAP